MIRPRLSEFPVGTLRSVQLWTTIAALVLAPLFFGSVDLFWVVVWTILLSLGVLCGTVAPSMQRAQGGLLLGFAVLCGAYALVAAIQIIPHAIEPLNDPIWLRANESFGLDTLPRISGRAAIPALAIGHFLLFATSFVSGFLVGTSRRSSEKLIRFAQYSILVYASYGIAALVVAPDTLLWTTKVAYRGYLTATFVNHNTAATYVGTGMILWFCLALSSGQSMRFSDLRILLMSRSNEEMALKVILRSAAAAVCAFAVLLTGSRAGLLCSSMGIVVALTLMAANKWKLPRRYIVAFALIASAVTIIWVSRLGRLASQGLVDENRLSVYHSSLQAIWQRPLLGSGAGTFPDLFPVFRSDVLWSWGVWDYAHSTILEIAFEMGIPVAAAVAMGATLSVVILIKAAIRASGRTDRRTLAAIAGIATLGFLHSTVDFSLQIPGFFVVFAILLGCGLATALAKQDRHPPRRSSARPALADQPPLVALQVPGHIAAFKSIGQRRAACEIAKPSVRFPEV
jgi:O-antigen ligase